MNRFAEEKWKNRFTTAAKENYNEMGLLTFSVVFYTLKNGQQAVDMYVYSSCSGVIRSLSQVFSHDNISELLGIPCKSFREMHKDKASEIMRNVVSYIQTVRAGAGTGPATGKRIMTIELNPDGFPIAPDPASLEKTTKADLETLYRRYITSHYCKLSKMHFQYDKE
jgi:hypothetical protein